MAEADSVPSSTRQLITGASVNPSTNLPAVTVKRSVRGYFIGGLGARCPTSDEKAALAVRQRHKKPGAIQPVGLLNRRWYEANAVQVPTGSNIDALSHAWRLLRNILLVVRRSLSRKRRLRFRTRENAIEKISSNQLVRTRLHERLK